jgi:predicted nucleotidyltransferase
MKNLKKHEEDFGLPKEVSDKLKFAFERNSKLNEVFVFGSRAKGTCAEGSDIDLAILGSDLSWNDLMDLRLDIEDMGLLYSVDLVDFNQLDEQVRGHIKRVGQPFWRRQEQVINR